MIGLLLAAVAAVVVVATTVAAAVADAVDDNDEGDRGTSGWGIFLGFCAGLIVGLVVGAIAGAVAAVLLLPFGIVVAAVVVIVGGVVGIIAAANKDLANSWVSSRFRSTTGGDENETPNWRPHFHFTPKKGWINDPCGLAVFGRTRHLFFQHLPSALGRGAISFARNLEQIKWGHAETSAPAAETPDVVSWNEGVAELSFDEELGCPFTGCAVTHSRGAAVFDELDLEEHGGKHMVLVFTRAKFPTLWFPTQ